MSVATLEPKTMSAPAPAPARTTPRSSPFERYDTINTSRIAVIGFVSAILLFGAVVSAQATFFAADRLEANRKAETWVPGALTDQQNRLTGYGWVEPAKGTVHIPVGDAMTLVLRDHQKESAAGR